MLDAELADAGVDAAPPGVAVGTLAAHILVDLAVAVVIEAVADLARWLGRRAEDPEPVRALFQPLAADAGAGAAKRSAALAFIDLVVAVIVASVALLGQRRAVMEVVFPRAAQAQDCET